MQSQLKIGLFGTGLDTYWGQFDGLLDVQYCLKIQQLVLVLMELHLKLLLIDI